MSTLALFASSSLVLLLLAAASALDCFGAEEYAASAFRVPDTNCRRIGNNSSSSGNSSFKLCALSAAEDWISEAVLLRRSQWQPGVVAAVSAAVRTAGAAGDNDVVLVDVGAHIGSVAVPVAAANEHARIWAVEPLEQNLASLYKSLAVNGLAERARLLHNAVDIAPGLNVTINAGVGMKAGGVATYEETVLPAETVRTITLENIVEDILTDPKTTSSPINLVLKLDVEQMECKAILGSADLFRRRDDIAVPYVVMEWEFFYDDDYDKFGVNHCPKGMQTDMTDMLLSLEYKPYYLADFGGKDNEVNWRPASRGDLLSDAELGDVLWQHAEAASILRPK